MSTNGFDQKKSEAFSGEMLGMLNKASLALMTSIGHQTGLFNAIADLPPSTSKQIALVAQLDERYVREWLGAMVTGRIVDHDMAEGTYSLPPEHAAWLTKNAGPDNMAAFMMFIPLLADVEQEIIKCFHNGGGVPYSAYPRFQKIMAESSGSIHRSSLIETILPLVPGLVGRLQAGIEAADIGCGHGHAINLLAEAFPASQFIGYDFSEEGISAGKREAAEMGLSNAHFELRDVATLDMSEQYEFMTAFDAIHDQAQPTRVLQGISKALKSDGAFLMVDIAACSNVGENIDHFLGPYLYTVSTMHCMTVSLALDGEGLGTAWGEQMAQQMLSDANFSSVEIKQIESDPFNNYYIATKG